MDWSVEDSFAPVVPPRKKLPKPPEKPVHLRDVATSLFADKLKRRLSTRKSKGRSFHYHLPDINPKLSDIASDKIIKSMSKHDITKHELMLRFITEEELYLADLRLIQKFYAEPMKQKEFLSPEEYNGLFGSLNHLIKKTQAFTVDLASHKERVPIDSFGKTLQKHYSELAPILMDYCSRKVVFLDLLFSIVDQNQQASEYLQTTKLDPKFRGLSLEDLLVAPIFRFESYTKSTFQLLEMTPKHHQDRINFEEAIEQLQAIQMRISTLVKENEHLLRISQLQQMLEKKYVILFNIFTFELEAEVEVFTSRGNTENTLILFSKTLLIAKKNISKISKRVQLLVVKRADIIYLDVSNVKSSDNAGNRLVVKIFGDPYTFVFKSESTRDKWANLLRGLISKEVEESVRRLQIDLSEESSARPDSARSRKVGNESEKMKSLLNENAKLAQQLSKISLASSSAIAPASQTPAKVPDSPAKTPRKRKGSNIANLPAAPVANAKNVVSIDDTTIMILYGPRFSGKTTLAKHIIHYFKKQNIPCAYVPENQLTLISIDPSIKSRKVDRNDLTIANVSVVKSILSAILDIKPAYKLIIIDGEFYETDTKNSIFGVVEHFPVRKIVCCCYAPFDIRKDRNTKDIEVRQCQPFELPPKGVFIDTSDPAALVLEKQILPLLKKPEVKISSNSNVVSVPPSQ